MPLYFPTNKGDGPMTRTGDRSNTGLIVGNHDTPNTQLLLDPDLPLLFHYEYGGPAQREVVISKGMALALTGERKKDYETGRLLPVVTIADGANPTHKPIGMAPYNFTQQRDNVLEGNKPVVINDKYVELPYIPEESDAELVKWGAVVGPDIKPGDWLKPATGDNKGKLTKWEPNRRINQTVADFTSSNEGKTVVYTDFPVAPGTDVWVSDDDATAVVLNSCQIEISDLENEQAYSGLTIRYLSSVSDPVELKMAQVLEAELDQEPWGWLKWAMWDEVARMEDYQAKFGTPDGETGYPYNADYRKGVMNEPGYLSDYTTQPTGVPGLLDGEHRAKKIWEETFVVAEATEEGAIVQKALDYFNVIPESLSVMIRSGAEFVPFDGEFTVNYRKGVVKILVDEALETLAASNDVEMKIVYKAHFFGTPTGWDHKGAVGAIRLLLQN